MSYMSHLFNRQESFSDPFWCILGHLWRYKQGKNFPTHSMLVASILLCSGWSPGLMCSELVLHHWGISQIQECPFPHFLPWTILGETLSSTKKGFILNKSSWVLNCLHCLREILSKVILFSQHFPNTCSPRIKNLTAWTFGGVGNWLWFVHTEKGRVEI